MDLPYSTKFGFWAADEVSQSSVVLWHPCLGENIRGNLVSSDQTAMACFSNGLWKAHDSQQGQAAERLQTWNLRTWAEQEIKSQIWKGFQNAFRLPTCNTFQPSGSNRSLSQ